MRKKGTKFLQNRKSAIQMCELFAKIHVRSMVVNIHHRFKKDQVLRLIFDDPGDAAKHTPGNESFQSYAGRKDAVAQAMAHNERWTQNRLHLSNVLSTQKYFFNDKHALFFKKEFPNIWNHIEQGAKISDPVLKMERNKMRPHPALYRTYYPMIVNEMTRKLAFHSKYFDPEFDG
jgi:hypothetical protein